MTAIYDLETWKDVLQYEGHYQVSNLGNIKSLKFNKEKILIQTINSSKYFTIKLCKNGKRETKMIHTLVCESFLNYKSKGFILVINHIDFNKLNNNLKNLEITTVRDNTNQKHIKSKSKYTGVSFYKQTKKWQSTIWINKLIHLGYFKSEIDAANAYKKALNDCNL